MADERLKSIRNYFDTSGTRLSNDDKEVLCNVIDNADKYNGFRSSVFEEHDSGRDAYKGRWESSTETQYKINIDESGFSIDEKYHHSCDDGYDNKQEFHLTDVRDVLGALRHMGDEL